MEKLHWDFISIKLASNLEVQVENFGVLDFQDVNSVVNKYYYPEDPVSLSKTTEYVSTVKWLTDGIAKISIYNDEGSKLWHI